MSRSVRLCFVCILSMLFVGVSGMAWARSIMSISVDKATSTATISCEAGEVGDGHVVYFAWSTDRVDYGDDIGDWPNFVRVGRIGDGTSATFSLPAELSAAPAFSCRAFLATSDRAYDSLLTHIVATGAQYVNTGVVPNCTTEMSVDIELTDTKTSQYAFGLTSKGGTSVSGQFTFAVFVSTGGMWTHTCSDTVPTFDISSVAVSKERTQLCLDSAGGKFTIVQGGRKTVVAMSSTRTIAAGLPAHPIPMFCRRVVTSTTSGSFDSVYFANLRFYSGTITNSGVCVRNYLPAIKDGVAGVYDSVNNTFIPSATSTAFVSGGETNFIHAVESGESVLAASASPVCNVASPDVVTDVPYVETASMTFTSGGSKRGAAPLTLTGANTWGGAFTVKEGTLVADFGQGLASTDNVVLDGGTYCTYATDLFTGFYGTGGGQLSFADGATEAGFSAYGHPLTVRLGGNAANTLATTGSTYRLTRFIMNDDYADNALTIENPLDLGANTVTAYVGAATATVKGGIRSDGTVTRTGAGTLVLSGTNSFSQLVLRGGTTVVAPPVGVVTNVLSVTNTFTAYNGGNLVVSNAETSIITPNSITTYAGSRLTFVGGKVKLQVTRAGDYYIRPGYDSTGTSYLVFDGARVGISDASQIGILCGHSNCESEIIVTNNATLSCSALSGRRGNFRQYSGKVEFWAGSAAFMVGFDISTTNNYYLYGGTLDQSAPHANDCVSVGGRIGDAFATTSGGKGNLYIYGGEAIFRSQKPSIGYWKYNTGALYVRGGSLSMPYSGCTLQVGRAGRGTFEVSGDGVATINGSVAALTQSQGTRTASISILTNGTLKARRVVRTTTNETDTATLLMDGGTLIANTSANTNFLYGFTTASIGGYGATIDTAGQNLTAAQSFAARGGQSAPVASTAAELAALPAFTKAGAGKLALTGTNTWVVATCVSNGTLVVGDRALPATTLQLRGGVIDLGGNSLTVANLVGFGVVSNGTLTVTGAVWPGVYESGTLKIDSTASLNMTTLGCCVAPDGTCGCLEETGTLDLAGVTVVGEGMANKGRKGLTLVRATAFSGSPTADASLAGNGVSFGSGTLRIGAPGIIIILR